MLTYIFISGCFYNCWLLFLWKLPMLFRFRIISRNNHNISLHNNSLYVLFVTFRLLFIGDPDSIYKAGLDGTNVTEIASYVGHGLGLDIDFRTNRICWAEYRKYHITASIKSTTRSWRLRVIDELLSFFPGIHIMINIKKQYISP